MDIQMEEVYLLWHVQWEKCNSEKSEILQGTLALMVMKILDALGAAAWVWNCLTNRASE
jgi:hypothetical protein